MWDDVGTYFNGWEGWEAELWHQPRGVPNRNQTPGRSEPTADR